MAESAEVRDGSLGDGLPVVREDGGGVQLHGAGAPPEIGREDWAALPPCPGPAVVAPALVPPPPLVRPDLSEDERVTLLLQAYTAVCRRQLPREWNPYSRGAGELKPAERKLLVSAAAALQQHEVSPIRWCEFSFDQWAVGAAEDGSKRGKKARGARPPLKIVFSVARIEEQAGWCRRERERRGGRLVLTRTLRHLLERWQSMRAAIFRGQMTASEARAKFLPPETWDRLVAKARAESCAEQKRIATELSEGAYLW